MLVQVSNGEVVDKITILQIKKNNIQDAAKLINIETELAVLQQSAKDLLALATIEKLAEELLKINTTLWIIEDKLREKERSKQFDEEFIELARSVYYTNDQRADIKKQINISTNSKLIEEKSYEQY